MAKDFNGKSDPYAVIIYGDQKAERDTSSRKEVFHFEEPGQNFVIRSQWL